MWTSIEPYSVLFVSALLSYLVSLFTTKAIFKSGINKDLFDIRQIEYQNTIKTFKKIEKNGYLIFNKDYVVEIEETNSRIQLIASKKIKKEIDSLSESILKKYEDYDTCYNEIAIDEEVHNRATLEENGIKKNIWIKCIILEIKLKRMLILIWRKID